VHTTLVKVNVGNRNGIVHTENQSKPNALKDGKVREEENTRRSEEGGQQGGAKPYCTSHPESTLIEGRRAEIADKTHGESKSAQKKSMENQGRPHQIIQRRREKERGPTKLHRRSHRNISVIPPTRPYAWPETIRFRCGRGPSSKCGYVARGDGEKRRKREVRSISAGSPHEDETQDREVIFMRERS